MPSSTQQQAATGGCPPTYLWRAYLHGRVAHVLLVDSAAVVKVHEAVAAVEEADEVLGLEVVVDLRGGAIADHQANQ